MGLRLRKALGAKNKAKEERTQKYLRLTKHLIQEFDKVEFV